jgi:tetratricopeptide (TPR) repeat protein
MSVVDNLLMENAMNRPNSGALLAAMRASPVANYDFMVVNFAEILLKTGHIEGAREYLDREIKEMPSYAPAWSGRAELDYGQGDLAAARADGEMALRLNSSDAQAQDILRRLDTSTPSKPLQ